MVSREYIHEKFIRSCKKVFYLLTSQSDLVNNKLTSHLIAYLGLTKFLSGWTSTAL